MKHVILFVLLAPGFFSVSAFARPRSVVPTLHVIYVLELADREYGVLNSINDTLMTQLLRTVEWGLGYRRKTTYLPRTDFTATALKKAIAALPTRPNDIVVLYYSGYGIMPDSNTGNFANWKLHDVSQKGLPVKEVDTWLMAKKVRLNLVIADCSGQFLQNNGLERNVGAGREDLRKQVIRRLFLTACGLVKLGSSLPLLPSWVNQRRTGSVFTGALHTAFGDLLRIGTQADLAQVSFQSLSQSAAGIMSASLGGMPFSQVPVLDMKFCQRTRLVAVPSPPAVDPLAPETLSSLFTAAVLNQDSAPTASIRAQLRALAQAEATVTVTQWVGKQFAGFKERGNAPRTYSLATYLAQKPHLMAETDSTKRVALDAWLSAIAVIRTEGDPSAAKPVSRFIIQEQWISNLP